MNHLATTYEVVEGATTTDPITEPIVQIHLTTGILVVLIMVCVVIIGVITMSGNKKSIATYVVADEDKTK